jgi:hypothetical protein
MRTDTSTTIRTASERRLALLGIVVASAWMHTHAAAADKASLACIRASDEGQSARDANDLLRARELFAQCTEAKCPAMIRRDCASWLEQVESQLPSVVLGIRDADGHDVVDARVAIDGQPIDEKTRGGTIELNPGPHVIRWEGAGEPVEIRIALRPQEKSRPVIATLARPAPAAVPAASAASPAQAPPPETSEVSQRGGLPVATYVLGGVGVAALGAFAYFGLRAKHDSDSMHDKCAPACAHDEVTALKTKVVVADIALGVGVAGVAAATFFAFRGTSRPKTGGAPQAAPSNTTLTWELHAGPLVGGAHADLAVEF